LKKAPENPEELGAVNWNRGYQKTSKLAESQNKPLLILFQEVPGCATCVGYGQRVLSHPLVVEAAETLFVPLAVYNNISGEDADTLKKFREPTWNNPVVRIVSESGQNLVPRLAGDYAISGLVGNMVKALEATRRPVPVWLEILNEEEQGRKNVKEATFAMSCFWTGEKVLGEIPGVLETRAGFMDGREVVQVAYDPEKVTYASLLKRAGSQSCASKVYAHSSDQKKQATDIVGENRVADARRMRPDSQPKYYMSHTLLRHIPMTPLQASRVNAAVGRRQNTEKFLSPAQLALLRMVEKNPKADWPDTIESRDIKGDWKKAIAVANRL
jgi:hypothetical protein